MALGVEGIKVGCWTHPLGHTGTTVILPPAGTVGGVAVRGGAPGSREVPALSPTGSVQNCHAVVLTGGSAFGLATADGVMAWCEERGVGFELPTVTVPIVGAAVVFDIRERTQARPDAAAGRAACEAASLANPPSGPYGVGAGCTAGKAAGRDWAVTAGQGWAVATSHGITVGALMAVNPVGDVVTGAGELLAGCRAARHAPRFPYASPEEIRAFGENAAAAVAGGGPPTNTVIGCLVTDAALSKGSACRAADLSHSGIARAVSPAHTSADGDILFLLATGSAGPASGDLVAQLGAVAVAEAIRSAVRHSVDGPQLPADPWSRRR